MLSSYIIYVPLLSRSQIYNCPMSLGFSLRMYLNGPCHAVIQVNVLESNFSSVMAFVVTREWMRNILGYFNPYIYQFVLRASIGKFLWLLCIQDRVLVQQIYWLLTFYLARQPFRSRENRCTRNYYVLWS